MVPLCRDQESVDPWSPLARGYLARAPETKGTKRSETDRFGKTLYSSMARRTSECLPGSTSWRRRATCLTLRLPGLAAPEGRRDGPHRGRDEDGAPRDGGGALAVQLAREDVTALEAPYVRTRRGLHLRAANAGPPHEGAQPEEGMAWRQRNERNWRAWSVEGVGLPLRRTGWVPLASMVAYACEPGFAGSVASEPSLGAHEEPSGVPIRLDCDQRDGHGSNSRSPNAGADQHPGEARPFGRT